MSQSKPQTRGDRAAKLAAKERAAIERKASASVVAAAGLAPKAPLAPAPPVATPGAGGAAGGSPGDTANVRRIPGPLGDPFPHNAGQTRCRLVAADPPTIPPPQPWDASKDLASGPPRKPTSNTGQWLQSPDNRATLCATVQAMGGVRPACEALELTAATVFWLANTDESFRDQLNGAWGACAVRNLAEIEELAAGAVEYAKSNPETANAVVSAVKFQCEMRLRIAGKLLPKLYGDKPSTDIHIGDKIIGLVCDEATRAKLIALREKITTAPAGSLAAPASTSVTIPGDRITFTDTNFTEDTHGRRLNISQG